MGCDIHLYVEVRKNNKWKPADSWLTYGKEYGHFEDDGDESKRPVVPYDDEYYNGRNYKLFAMLANVRNGVGFAGIDTGNAVNPISEPKGLPEDVSDVIEKCSEYWGSDGHSHSYLTVKELMEYDWTQTATYRGTVSAWEYVKWSSWGKERGLGPESYCGSITGASVRHVTEKQMKAIIDDILEEKGKEKHQLKQEDLKGFANTFCKIEWKTPYYESAQEFLSQTIPRLWKLGKPEDVRIVFWFDN